MPDITEIHRSTPAWVNVALSGWRSFLEYYGLDEFRAMPCEREALHNLEQEARRIAKVGQSHHVTKFQKELIALEIYYMTHFERREFQSRYYAFQQTLPNKAAFQLSHRYQWIADRIAQGYEITPDGFEPTERRVMDWIALADTRLELLEARGVEVDLYIDITWLLRARRQRKAA